MTVPRMGAIVPGLVALLLVSCRTVEVAPRPDVFAIPESVPSPYGPVPVLVVDSIRGADTTLFLLGAYDSARRIIYLRRDLAPAMKYAVLQHEVCHVRSADAGLHNLMPARLMDAVCDVWATDRTASLLSNPGR